MAAGNRHLPGHVPVVAKNLAALGDLPADSGLNLVIGVPLRDPAGLEKFLAELYDPASPNYRQFLTPDEFAARFAATGADYARVKAFASAHNLQVTAEYGNRLLLDVHGRASDVERAFGVRLKKYKHPAEPREFFAPETEPVVDSDLPVADVEGLSDFPRPFSKLRKMDKNVFAPKNGSAPGGSGAYFGDDFRNAYAPGVALTGNGQQVGLFQLD